MGMIKAIENRLAGGHLRTITANRNVFYSFMLKGLNIVVQLALVPLLLHYLDISLYGIWLTISSVLLWLSFFDIGIGNGLKIRLSKSLAENDTALAKTYISTAYASVAILFSVLFIIFLVLNSFIYWSAIFNISSSLSRDLNISFIIVVAFACLQFVSGLISSVLFAKQKMALHNAIVPVSNLLSLVIVSILVATAKPSLQKIALFISAAQPLTLIAFSIYLFAGPYKNIRPSLTSVNFKYTRDLLNLGAKFLVIQFASLMIYSFSNILIAHWFGPAEVTLFNIAYKYFTIGIMVNGIICLTYWSSLTQAFASKDYSWIIETVKKLEFITFIIMGIVILSVWVADPVISIWVGKQFQVPFLFKISMSAATCVWLFSTPQNMLVNGSGRLHVQFMLSLISIILFIPLAYVFSRLAGLGPAGIVAAMIVTILPTSVLIRIQYQKIISHKASGIWNRE